MIQLAGTSAWIDLHDSAYDPRSRVTGAVDLDGSGTQELVYVARDPGYDGFTAWVLAENYSDDERFNHIVAFAKCRPGR